MANAHPAQEQPPRAESTNEAHVNQAQQWREIGIPAVAAGARYAAQATAAGSEPQKKVVTLRDIDHLAA